MNAPDTYARLLALTREPFPASTKTHLQGSLDDLRVPMREVLLSNGERIALYDTSGPYTDPRADIDVRRGLPSVRGRWIESRGDTETYEGRVQQALDDGAKGQEDARLEQLRREASGLQRQPRRAKSGANVTQMHYARRGIVTPEMEYVALRENGRREWMQEYLADPARERRLRGNPMGASLPALVTPEFVRDEVARGRAIIPANINHPEVEPMAIGRNFLVKINANIGNSAVTSSIEEEVEKLVWAIRWGADNVMDLSTGRHIHTTRDWIVRNSPVPIGTVPIYQALEKVGGVAEDLTWAIFRDTLIEQAEQGVDYFTIHAGVRLPFIHLTADRRTGIVSRGGSIMAKWCISHHQESFLYTHFEDICDIMKAYDVSFSLGDGLRPGSGADANDEAQFAELRTARRADAGGLEARCADHDRRPGPCADAHDPGEHGRAAQALPGSAVLHARPADDRHRAGLRPHLQRHRRGDDRLVRHRHAVLRDTQGAPGAARPRRRQAGHRRLQDRRPCGRCGQGASRRAGPRRRLVEGALRVPLDGPVQPLARPPTPARDFHDETLPKDSSKVAHFCSMCGPKFCSMKITQEVREYAAQRGVGADEALNVGMDEKSSEFRQAGGQIYIPLVPDAG